ncbi:P-loop containing nucleoside triphosphate hydrolase protein [Aspergillus pseudocaelatus]|uniref:RNA helicase n=1 Tax=Aspergillus pseudocaelatus TaxID=1825620 RepID=A0ABQ6WB01_9EURO|nr:P-loop containing nucleoside triphosphate hydrolase protein [Aspergillus pseudocaelatus]
MQSHMSIRHVSCFKDGPSQIRLAPLNPSRPSQPRNIAARRYTTVLPSVRTRNLATEVCRSLLEPRRVGLRGSLAPYCMTKTRSTAACAFEQEATKASLERSRSQERGSVAENGSACDDSGLLSRIPDVNTASAVDESQYVSDALPREEDYNGFGKVLLRSPKPVLQSEFVQKGLIRLNSRFVSRGKDKFDCAVDCTLQHTSTIIATPGTGSSKSSAELQALLALISRLHTSGSLQELNELREELQYMKLHIDEDMFIVMFRALRDLKRARHFSTAKCSGGQIGSSISTDQEGFNEQNKADSSLGLPIGRLWKRQGRLPISRRKDDILDLIEKTTYSLIVADTGSGKSTQVPQMLLDDAMVKGSGSSCKILCVQPRRIAATSLAKRVAKERRESLGYSVGYQIRFDSRRPTRLGSITYCTTGYLLNMLHSESYLVSFSHIILDEVHERALDLDLLMLFLRNFVDQRRGLGLHAPKIVVMSATLDVGLFASYFQNAVDDGGRLPAPHLCIPGRAFPVGKHYLDEVIKSLSRFYSPRALSLLIDEPQTAKYLRRYNLLPVTNRPNSDEEWIDGDQHLQDSILPQSSSSIFREEDPLIPLGLICAVICYVLSSTEGGSILVFLPGLRHIMAVESAVQKHGKMLGCDFSDYSRYKILQLHSNLPDGQKELFRPISRACRRVILSTDVAETSITIPDVKFVIDIGKVNQRIYEPHSRSTRFACCWISQSSAAQRAGRAGRVQAGEYFALFTRDMHNSFRVTRFPGMMREDLQQTSLQVKRTVSSASIQDTLRDSIEPPDEAKVDLAISNLQLLRALDEKEELTPLGVLLSELPLDPCRAKLVLLGVIFRCLDPLLIIGVIGGDQSLFYSSADQETRKDVHRARVEFSRNTWSDHLSMANAFRATREVWYRTGRAAAFEFAVSNHIHFDRAYEVLQAARHTLEILAKKKIISCHEHLDEHFQFGGASLNTNSWRTPLIKALLFHVMYPNLAAPSSASRRRYFTETNEMTHISPSSANSTERPRSLFIFNSKNKPSSGETYFLKQTSHVTPLAACLLGGRLQGSGRRICMDSWLDFLVQANEGTGDDRAARLLIGLRKTIQMAFDAAFHSLGCLENYQPTEDPKSTRSHDILFNMISETLIDILDRDNDPVYSKRVNTATQWA